MESMAAAPEAKTTFVIRLSKKRAEALYRLRDSTAASRKIEVFAAFVITQRLLREAPGRQLKRVAKNDNHRTAVNALMAQKILHVSQQDGMNAQVLAKRFGVGATTIRRILNNYAEAEHVEIPQHGREERGKTYRTTNAALFAKVE